VTVEVIRPQSPARTVAPVDEAASTAPQPPSAQPTDAPPATAAAIEAARRSPPPTATAARARATSAGDAPGTSGTSPQPGAPGSKRLETPQPQRPGGPLTVSQRIQMFETKSTPCLRQASVPPNGANNQPTAGDAAAAAATVAVAGAPTPAAGGGSHSMVKSSSSYTPAQKPASQQNAKEPPRSQSEMRGGHRPQGTTQSARSWRAGSTGADTADSAPLSGRGGALTPSASVGKFPNPPAGGGAASSQGGSLHVPATNSGKLGKEAFERLAAGGRRNDVERPKSLKVAEQVRLQKEQKHLAKQQEEELRQQAKLQQQQAEEQQRLLQQQEERQRLLQQQQQQEEREREQERERQLEQERQQHELEREREREREKVAQQATQPAAVQPTEASQPEVAQASSGPSNGPAVVEEETEPEAEASARLEPQPAPEPGDSLDGGALTDCEDEPPAAPPEPPSSHALLRSIILPLKRVEDNYVISDHGSDSEAEDQEQQKEKERTSKHVPKWCETYVQDLARQSDIDPDSVFGSKVPRCSLEDIFTDQAYQQVGRHRPKRTRGSSGDWRKDRLAKHEVLHYKTRMGQVRNWDADSAPVASSSTNGVARH